MTGLSGAGKSTIANAFQQHLLSENCTCSILDGDQLRTGLNQDLGFSTKEADSSTKCAALD
jgi:adenylylsulfate kinase-like enzyme